MEQPNAGGDGDARLTGTFWVALVLTGVAAGGFGIAMMAVLHAVQHLPFDYRSGAFGVAVERASDMRRLTPLVLGGALVGPAWYVVRRRYRSQSTDVDDAVWTGTGELPFRRSLATGVISEVAVGAGASLGREAAPKLIGAAAGSALARWTRLDPAQRRLLVACGGGAGMGAVYNVPLGGALITAELLYGQLSLAVLLPALTCSVVATTVGWAYLPTQATYSGVATFDIHPTQVGFALVAGPLIGLLAAALVRLVGWVAHHQLRDRLVLVGPLLAFSLLGLLAIPYPLLLAYGKDLTHEAFLSTGREGVGLLLALALLMPLVTVLCQGSGANGGLFTPVMATGAVVGLLLGDAWTALWPGAPVASLAVISAAAMTGAAMQAPLAALVLVFELTRTTEALAVPLILATTLAILVVRYVDGYSIYSARLPGRPTEQNPVDALNA